MHEIACRSCVAQRERIEELEEEVRQLRQAATGGEILPLRLGVHLTVREDQIVRLLLARDALTKNAYIMARAHENWDGDIKVLDVYICRIRGKLAAIGLEIETIWGRGYRFSPATKKRIMEMHEAGAMGPGHIPAARGYLQVQAALRDVLHQAPDGMSWTTLKQCTGLSDSKLQQALNAMVNRDECRRLFKAGRANCFVYTLAEVPHA